MAIIYAKTAAGQQEIETRARRLTPRVRSLLIMIDGKRSETELGALVQQLDETLPVLLEAGLIQVVPGSVAKPPAEAPARAPQPRSGDDSPELRREAVRAITDLLGPGAETMALRIERATDAGEVRAVLERAVAYIANARGGAAAAQFAARFVK